jgi:hypothetical protein
MLSLLLAAALTAFAQLEPSPEPIPSVSFAKSFPDAHRLTRRLLLPAKGEDRDGDGLRDEAENELAAAFQPFVVLDSHEKATRPGEPVILYQIRPEGCVGPANRCHSDLLTLSAVYAHLWEWDGGYGPDSPCGDKHKGDNQDTKAVFESRDGGLSFRLAKVEIGSFVWPKGHAMRFQGGTHPTVYFSSGKHHPFVSTGYDRKDSPYSKWACNDNVDGRGAAFFPALELSGVPNNVGEPENPLIGPLGPYGFAGEDAWDDRPFCGGVPCDRARNITRQNRNLWSSRPFHKADAP